MRAKGSPAALLTSSERSEDAILRALDRLTSGVQDYGEYSLSVIELTYAERKLLLQACAAPWKQRVAVSLMPFHHTREREMPEQTLISVA